MKKFKEVLEDWEVQYGPHRFGYNDLFIATKGFTELLGRGGFGRVYRGVLPTSNIEVAVKGVAHDSRQGLREFVAEIATIGRLRHPNLVRLLGYCRRKQELLLVYDYMPNGSLDRGNILEAIDRQLGTEYAVEEAKLLLKLGLLCAHAIAAARPSMCTVMQYLEGRAQLPDNLGDIIKSRDFGEASNEQDVQLPTSVTSLTISEPFTSIGR
ncbi:hypothetical protein C3L33_16788, partial [Rhododendron williamsianum]